MGFRSLVVPVIAVALGSSLVAQTPRPAGTGQDLKLHGHWVIEVTNPDGSVAERREFDNALTADGKGILAATLAKGTLEDWTIELTDSQGAHPCVNTSHPQPCFISEPSYGANSYTSPNLQITLPTHPVTHVPLGTMQLSGNIVASNGSAAAFDSVGTIVNYTVNNVGFQRRLTAHSLPRVSVTLGQLINVVVTFSFS